jgi:hypothetical protein
MSPFFSRMQRGNHGRPRADHLYAVLVDTPRSSAICLMLSHLLDVDEGAIRSSSRMSAGFELIERDRQSEVARSDRYPQLTSLTEYAE